MKLSERRRSAMKRKARKPVDPSVLALDGRPETGNPKAQHKVFQALVALDQDGRSTDTVRLLRRLYGDPNRAACVDRSRIAETERRWRRLAPILTRRHRAFLEWVTASRASGAPVPGTVIHEEAQVLGRLGLPARVLGVTPSKKRSVASSRNPHLGSIPQYMQWVSPAP